MEPRSGRKLVINGVIADFDSETLRTESGHSVSLRPQAFAVLRCLAEHAGRLVTKGELMQAVWPGIAVTDDSLVQCIHEIRRALRDDARAVLKTAPKRGYRLVLPTETPSRAAQEQPPNKPVPGGGAPSLGPVSAPDYPTPTDRAKASIAVLPFVNISSDPEQDYFADGIVEEIITALSRMRWLFVIARNSSFTYKGRVVDVKQVGRELGVRYVLEGSVRKADSRVRISGQLIDATTGAHLWADRFDGDLADIFHLQDQVAASAVAAIAPRLEDAEIKRAKGKPTENLDAYDYFLRGMAAFHQWTREGINEALQLFYRAIERDPSFAAAYARAAACYARRKSGGWVTDREFEVAEAGRLARLAVELGRDDPVALTSGGFTLAYVVGDLDIGAALIERALALNPNMAWAWFVGGWVKVWLGEPEIAIERQARAMRLSPHDPQIFNMHTSTAAAHFFAGRYNEALSWAELSVREQPNSINATSVAAASAALAGNEAAARKALGQLRQLAPRMRISNLRDHWPIRRPEDLSNWANGLRKAGFPD